MNVLRYVTAKELHEMTSYEAIGAHQICGNLLVQTVNGQVMVTQDEWVKYVALCMTDKGTGNEALYREKREIGSDLGLFHRALANSAAGGANS